MYAESFLKTTTVIGTEESMTEGEKICEEICVKASRNCSRRIPTLRISFSLASPMSVKRVDCAFSQTSLAAEPGRAAKGGQTATKSANAKANVTMLRRIANPGVRCQVSGVRVQVSGSSSFYNLTPDT